jgi:hypothetical protein
MKLALAVFVVLLAGCSIPGTTLRHAPPNPDIAGIESVLSAGARADVVLIHGMCFKDIEWMRAANRGLAEALGMTFDDRDKEGSPIGQFGGRLFVNELRGARGSVRTFAILWSPAAAVAREALCYDTTQPSETCPASAPHLADRRAVVNALLKNKIMDDCLSEAVFAVGEEGIARVGSTVEKGLEIALAGGTAESAPLFVVAQSLGSKLFVDAIIRMANRSCDAAVDVAHAMKRTVQIFMEANQLPVLALAYNPRLKTDCEGGMKALSAEQATGLGALGALRATSTGPLKSVTSPLKVAAFSDPNDILSWTLVPAPGMPAGVERADIVLANDWSILGLFENPLAAHLTYGQRCRVQRVIAKGTAGLAESC